MHRKTSKLGATWVNCPGISPYRGCTRALLPWLSIRPICSDDKTPQPLIAVRQYGAGAVVYLGFNETWRLRRLFGEQYYRQFWSQLIYRLGMSHALGVDKRFVVRIDRQQYRSEDKVILTVEAYDENFEPLSAEKLPGKALSAKLQAPGVEEPRAVEIPELRPGVFEARIPVYNAGAYSIQVDDPVTDDAKQVRFEVTGLSAERRSAVRNTQLQNDLARLTQGKSYDLTTASRLVDDLEFEPVAETYARSHPLWSTPLWFALLVVLMLTEWLIRKLINLA